MPPYSTHQERITYADGAWADMSVVRFPAETLRFEDILLRDPYLRMRDAARLRYYKARVRGEADPLIIAWACLEDDRAALAVFPGIEAVSDDGEHLLSANSFVTYTLRALLARGWLRWEREVWSAAVPASEALWRERAETVLRWLQENNRLWLETGPDHASPPTLDFAGVNPAFNLIPVGRCGFVRDAVRERLPRVAFNASYFLLEHDDFLGHHSALGDPYGLLVQDGAIMRPPLYRRGAIWHGTDGQWQIGRIGMNDVCPVFPDGSTLGSMKAPADFSARFHLNPAEPVPVAVYTRYFGVPTHGRVLGRTPVAPNRIELTVVDRHIVGWKRGGDLLIPQNGFALSFAADALPEDQLQAVLAEGHLAYALTSPEHQGMTQALQCGPILIQDGHITLTPTTLDKEAYWISREGIVGVVPTDYPDDIDRTRAARIGLGIDAGGDLMVVAISGTSKGLAVPGRDSVGATLVELTAQLQAAGAVEAINLDGGGSVQLFVEGGLYNRPGDQRGHPGVIYERMVPSIGLVP